MRGKGFGGKVQFPRLQEEYHGGELSHVWTEMRMVCWLKKKKGVPEKGKLKLKDKFSVILGGETILRQNLGEKRLKGFQIVVVGFRGET